MLCSTGIYDALRPDLIFLWNRNGISLAFDADHMNFLMNIDRSD